MKKLLLAIAYILIIFSIDTFAQTNPFAQFVGKRYAEYHYALRDTMRKRYKSVNQAFVDLSARQMKSLPDKFHDGQWQIEADFLETNFNYDWMHGSETLFVSRLKNLLAKSKKYKNNIWQIRILRRLFDYYKDFNLIEAVSCARQLEKELPKVTIEEYPDVIDNKYHLAEMYLKYHDYLRANKYYKEVIESPVFDPNQRITILALNDMGILYREYFRDLNKSDKWFNAIFSFDKKYHINEIRMHRFATAYSELGRNEFLRHQFSKAEPLLLNAIRIMTKETNDDNDNDHTTYYNTACTLAECYSEMKQYNDASLYLHKADSCFNYINPPVTRQDYFIAKSKYYGGINNRKLSNLYLDSAFVARNNWDMRHNMNLFYEIEQHIGSSELQQKSAESRSNYNKFIATFILCIAIAIVLVLYILLYIQKRNAYRSLVLKNQQWAEENKPYMIISSLKKKSQTDTNDKIYRFVEDYMIKTKCYCNADLTLEQLTKELGVNRTYLSNAINKENENFTTFINNYRIRYAIRILSKQNDNNIEEVALKVGFNNRKSFYNAFKTSTGLSPTQFKRNIQTKILS